MFIYRLSGRLRAHQSLLLASLTLTTFPSSFPTGSSAFRVFLVGTLGSALRFDSAQMPFPPLAGSSDHCLAFPVCFEIAVQFLLYPVAKVQFFFWKSRLFDSPKRFRRGAHPSQFPSVLFTGSTFPVPKGQLGMRSLSPFPINPLFPCNPPAFLRLSHFSVRVSAVKLSILDLVLTSNVGSSAGVQIGMLYPEEVVP